MLRGCVGVERVCLAFRTDRARDARESNSGWGIRLALPPVILLPPPLLAVAVKDGIGRGDEC